MTDFLYIRDQIVINDVLMAHIASQHLPPGSTVRLVAQEVRNHPGFVWRMPGQHIVIVAGEYNNDGGAIDVSGPQGAGGARGATGIAGCDAHHDAQGDHGGTPGGTGALGQAEKTGTVATSARITCELLRASELRLFANGGGGGAGGEARRRRQRRRR